MKYILTMAFILVLAFRAHASEPESNWLSFPEDPQWVYTVDDVLGYNVVTKQFFSYDWNFGLGKGTECKTITYNDDYVYCDNHEPQSLEGFITATANQQ